MKKYLLAAAAVALLAGMPQIAAAADAPPPGKELNMVLLPKFLGIAVFDQAHQGALEAAKELQNPKELQFLGPTPENSVAGQIEIVTNAATQGVNAIMMSNNSGDQIVPAAKAAHDKGIKVVTWDSPIPSAEGEDVFVAQVDFTETGKVMADMALNILGADGGKLAILSASPDAANQNAWNKAFQDILKNDPKYAKLQVVDLVYGDDQSEKSYNQALALVDKHRSASSPPPRRCRTRSSATRSRSPASATRPRWAATPRTAARRSSPCGASSTSATSPTTPPMRSPPAR
jgi:rhamnose transport system substrate-binding protein